MSRPSRQRRTGRATTEDRPVRGTRRRTETLESRTRAAVQVDALRTICSSPHPATKPERVWRDFVPRSSARAQPPSDPPRNRPRRYPQRCGPSACRETRPSEPRLSRPRRRTKPPPRRLPRRRSSLLRPESPWRPLEGRYGCRPSHCDLVHGVRSPAEARPSTATSGRADARTRTGDFFITSEVLYQLSYVGSAWRDSGLMAMPTVAEPTLMAAETALMAAAP